MKRIVILLLTLCFALAMFSGCSSDTSNDADNGSDGKGLAEDLDPVDLTWYVIGDKSPDHDRIWGILNEKTLADPNVKASVTCKFMAWSDWQSQYGLVLASGETFDMIFTANWAFYGEQAAKGAFMELTDDLLNTYAPNVVKNTPEEAWKQADVDGKIYTIPNVPFDYDEWAIQLILGLRGDFMDEFGMDSITSIPEWEDYLAQVKEKHPEIVPYDEGNSWSTPLGIFYTEVQGLFDAQTLPFGTVDLAKEDGGGVVAMPGRDDRDNYLDALAKCHEFLEKGYWSRTALSNTVRTQDLYTAGKSATVAMNLGTTNLVYQTVMTENPDWKPYIANILSDCPYTVRTGCLGCCFSINANAANPERALMWIDAVRYTQEYADLGRLGIEGEHWILGDNGTTSSGPKASNITSWSWWAITDWETGRMATDKSPQYNEIASSFEKQVSNNIAIYMNYSTAGVENEIAALTVLQNEYEPNFNLGLYDDYEAKLDEYVEALENAGWQKCADAYADQIKAYMVGKDAAAYNQQISEYIAKFIN